MTTTTAPLLTAYARALIAIAADPDATQEAHARAAGCTPRYLQRLVADLEAAGYLTRRRSGRRVGYELTAAAWGAARTLAGVVELRKDKE